MSRTLLVIDIQNDYFPGGFLPLYKAQEVEERIVAAIGCARQAGDHVIVIRHVSDARTGLLVSGGDGVSLRPAIVAAVGETPVVTKRVADAFQDTDLARHLEGTTELLVCGMMTQNCVVFTAMSEAAAAYKVTVIGDLCTAPTEIVHQIALSALGSKLRVQNSSDIWPAA